jgi:hypothetical protein
MDAAAGIITNTTHCMDGTWANQQNIACAQNHLATFTNATCRIFFEKPVAFTPAIDTDYGQHLMVVGRHRNAGHKTAMPYGNRIILKQDNIVFFKVGHAHIGRSGYAPFNRVGANAPVTLDFVLIVGSRFESREVSDLPLRFKNALLFWRLMNASVAWARCPRFFNYPRFPRW